MRSTARECVFKCLFSRLFNQDDEGLFEILTKDLNKEDKQFAKTILDNAIANENKYLEAISNLSVGFKLNRVFNADRCALIVGMSEMDCFPDTDKPIIIDEAVKLSAIFSTEKSTDFVNGILAEYLRSK